MKKTVIALTTLASLSTLGANNADAAAHGRDDAASNVTYTSNASTNNYSYSYSYSYDYTTNTTTNYTSNTTAASYASNTTAEAAAPVVRTVSTSADASVRSFSQETVAKKPAASTTNVNNNVAALANSMAASRSYVYGSNSASAVDCSAFAQQVLAALGKSVPRTTYAQMAAGTPVSTPQPGDLVFFNGGSHVGVYIGNGQMVDALNPAAGVGQRAVSYISGSVTGYYRY